MNSEYVYKLADNLIMKFVTLNLYRQHSSTLHFTLWSLDLIGLNKFKLSMGNQTIFSICNVSTVSGDF